MGVEAPERVIIEELIRSSRHFERATLELFDHAARRATKARLDEAIRRAEQHLTAAQQS